MEHSQYIDELFERLKKKDNFVRHPTLPAIYTSPTPIPANYTAIRSLDREQDRNELHRLKDEILLLKNEVSDAHSKCEKLEDRCESLKLELSNFTKYESVKKVKQIEDHLETLNQNLKSIIKEMTISSNELNQKECCAVIEQQMAQYRQRKIELSQAGIAFMSEPNFSTMIEDYHKICKINDARIKGICKALHEATQRTERKTDKFTLEIDASLEASKLFTEEENNKLKELDRKSVQDSMNVEKELYADILETIADRMFVFDSIKATVEGRNTKTKTNAHRKSYQNLIEKFEGSLDAITGNSIIMYKLPESNDGEDDLTKVKSFLNQANLKTDIEITIKKLLDPGNPLKVTFSDTQVVEQLLQLPNEKTFFRGSYVRMKKCDE